MESKLVEDHLFGHEFLPGGNMASYRQGRTEYELFLIQLPDAQSAANLLFEYKTKLQGAKVEAMERRGGWTRVKSEAGEEGWVRMLLLRHEGAGAAKQGESGVMAAINVARTGTTKASGS